MALTAQNIIDRASATLNDLGLVRWPQAEMLKSISDAEKAVQKARPDLFEVVDYYDLIAGPKQDVPADCYMLFDVVYNVDANDIPILGISKVKRTDMDRCKINWMKDDPEKIVQHWMQDDRERGWYFVYPPQPDKIGCQGRIMLRYSRRPADITSASDTLTVGDEMVNPVYYFTVMRMLEKDEKFAGSPQAQRFMNLFAQNMGVRTEGEDQSDEMRREREE